MDLRGQQKDVERFTDKGVWAARLHEFGVPTPPETMTVRAFKSWTCVFDEFVVPLLFFLVMFFAATWPLLTATVVIGTTTWCMIRRWQRRRRLQNLR